MKYYKSYNLFNESNMENDKFRNAVPKNYKQSNAILANNRPPFGSYEYDKNGDTDYTEKIYKFLIDNDYKNNNYNKTSYYFSEVIPAGDVKGYKNTVIDRVTISSENAVTFHFKFEVENPFIDEINSLKKEEEKFQGIKDKEEWVKVEDEWSKIYDRRRELDSFIPNFSYAYSQSLRPEIIENVYNEMIKHESLSKSEYISSLYKKIHKHRYKIETLPYKDRLDYWDWMDEMDDLTNYRNPSEADLEERNIRRNKSEEDYKKENEYMNDLLKDL